MGIAMPAAHTIFFVVGIPLYHKPFLPGKSYKFRQEAV